VRKLLEAQLPFAGNGCMMEALYADMHKLIPDCPLTMFFLVLDESYPGGYQDRLSCPRLDFETPANLFSPETEVLICHP